MHYPVTKPVRSAVPTFEPITLEEAKQQLGLQGNESHNQWLLDGIAFAREQVEKDAMVVCATGTFTWKRTVFASGDYFELASNLKPVSSIASIVYTAVGGSSTTFSALAYTLDTSPAIPIVRLNDGYSWPTLRGDINGITITLVAGYASQGVIPQRIKQAVILKVQELWQVRMEMHREAESSMTAYDRIVNSLRGGVYA
jgi:uncharacterized phiE125 gp8 family phage protein